MKRTTRLPASDVILCGADYNPGQWLGQEHLLIDDITLMKKARVTSELIGVFSCSTFDPEAGAYKFE